jgi:hypothetical protein
MRLDFHQTHTQLTRWDGGEIVTYPVATRDIGEAFSTIGTSTGILHPNLVFQSVSGGKKKLGYFMEAQTWTVGLMTSGQKMMLEIPLPSFIFIGHGKSYGIVAVKQRPLSEDEPLYHFPAPNVSGRQGSICWGSGSGSLPQAVQKAMPQVGKMFLTETWFNDHMQAGRCQSGDIHTLWQMLHEQKKRKFPYKELIQSGKVQDLL